MDPKVVASVLLTFVPEVEERFQARNRAVLEGLRDGGNSADMKTVGLLLEAWGRYRDKMSNEQAAALASAIGWYIEYASSNPDLLYRAIRILSNWPMALNWSDPVSNSAARALITQSASTIRGHGRQAAADALSLISSAPDVPNDIKAAIEKESEELRRGLNADRPTSQVSAASISSSSAATPTPELATTPVSTKPSKGPPTDQVCAALRALKNLFVLDRWRRPKLEAAVNEALASPGTNRTHRDLAFFSDIVLQGIQTRVEDRPTNIDPRDINHAYTLASFLGGQTWGLTFKAGAFAFWLRAFVDIKRNLMLPIDLVPKLEQQAGVLGPLGTARLEFLRFAYDYLDDLDRHRQLDARGALAWLEAVRLVALQKGVVDPALRDILADLVRLAGRFSSDAAVGAVLALLDPAGLPHPWTQPGAFEKLSSDACRRLEAAVKGLDLRGVHDFLTSPDVVKCLREQLQIQLADRAQGEFREPKCGTKPASVAEACRIFERTARIADSDDYGDAREWYAYLLERAGDLDPAMRLWEDAHRTRSASSEERWNLAVSVLRVRGDAKASFEVLWEPWVRSSNAPYEHARFSAALALEASWPADAFPIAALHVIPLASAHALAYALSPPTDTEARRQALGTIRALADDPFEEGLRKLSWPKSLSFNDYKTQHLVPLRDRLIRLGLKSTWRLLLCEQIQRYPANGRLYWELYDSWKQDDPAVARKVVDRGLIELSDVRGGVSHSLAGYLTQYLQDIPDPDLRFIMPIARRYEGFFKREYPRLAERLWPPCTPTPPPIRQPAPVKPTDPWEAMIPLLIRDSNLRRLSDLVRSAFAALRREAPDVAERFDEWQRGFEQLTSFLDQVATQNPESDQTAELNDWLLSHPPSSCSGLLSRARPLAEWMRNMFAEVMRERELAPRPVLRRLATDPGIPTHTSQCDAVVEVVGPEAYALSGLRVVVEGHDPRGEEEPMPLNLAAECAVSVGVPLQPQSSFAVGQDLHLRVRASYSWGVVDRVSAVAELNYPCFDFGSYLANNGIGRDTLPGNIFFFDASLQDENLDRLFQGRLEQIGFVRRKFASLDHLSGTPIYLQGIRKVGKTSLLNRIARPDILPASRYVPLYVNLFGLRETESLVGMCSGIRSGLVEALQRAGLQDEAPPILDGDDYKVIESYRELGRWLHDKMAPRYPVLLIDEFQLLTHSHAQPLLDTIRMQYQSRQILFVLAGVLDHEVMSRLVSSSLFPLEEQHISFLAPHEVEALVQQQFGANAVVLGSGTLPHLMRLTAGHPNIVQRLCGLAVEELNRYRRPVLTLTDIDRVADRIVDDGTQFTHSWCSERIVTSEEREALNEMVDLVSSEGAWLDLDRVPGPIRTKFLLPLTKKDTLDIDSDHRRLRIKGLILERWLRRVRHSQVVRRDPARSNVAFVVDWENMVGAFRAGTGPARIAKQLRQYVGCLGNIVSCIVVANWPLLREKALEIKTAFKAEGFTVLEPLRTQDQSPGPRSAKREKEVADAAIVNAVFNRLLEEYENDDRTVDIYAIASHDGGFTELVQNLVERCKKRVRLLADRNNPMLHKDLLDYEARRKMVAAMPNVDPEPSFVIDDLRTFVPSPDQALSGPPPAVHPPVIRAIPTATSEPTAGPAIRSDLQDDLTALIQATEVETAKHIMRGLVARSVVGEGFRDGRPIFEARAADQDSIILVDEFRKAMNRIRKDNKTRR